MSLCKLLRADMQKLEVKGNGIVTMVACLLIRPGFLAVFLWRLSSVAIHKGTMGRVIAKFLWRLNVLLSACDLEPLAIIGPGLHIPHPMGIVMGHATIGSNVKILQHVTLGIRRFTDRPDRENYPHIGDNVIISAGAVLTGGITIGNNAVIGANAVVTMDVPDNGVAVGIPARVVSRHFPHP